MCRSLNIPRPREETLSRHSILGPTSQQPRRQSAPVRVSMFMRNKTRIKYKGYINVVIIEIAIICLLMSLFL